MQRNNLSQLSQRELEQNQASLDYARAVLNSSHAEATININRTNELFEIIKQQLILESYVLASNEETADNIAELVRNHLLDENNIDFQLALAATINSGQVNSPITRINGIAESHRDGSAANNILMTDTDYFTFLGNRVSHINNIHDSGVYFLSPQELAENRTDLQDTITALVAKNRPSISARFILNVPGHWYAAKIDVTRGDDAEINVFATLTNSLAAISPQTQALFTQKVKAGFTNAHVTCVNTGKQLGVDCGLWALQAILEDQPIANQLERNFVTANPTTIRTKFIDAVMNKPILSGLNQATILGAEIETRINPAPPIVSAPTPAEIEAPTNVKATAPTVKSIKTVPVETTPIETVPVEIAAVKTTPVEAARARSEGMHSRSVATSASPPVDNTSPPVLRSVTPTPATPRQTTQDIMSELDRHASKFLTNKWHEIVDHLNSQSASVKNVHQLYQDETAKLVVAKDAKHEYSVEGQNIKVTKEQQEWLDKELAKSLQAAEYQKFRP